MKVDRDLVVDELDIQLCPYIRYYILYWCSQFEIEFTSRRG